MSPKSPESSGNPNIERARIAILKATGQKPLEPGTQAYGFVSTGSFNVDQLIGGTKTLDGKGSICPGFPRRKITEVYGAESSGKTTLLISAMVQAQRAGGMAMLLDFEHSIDLTYAQKIGLSLARDKIMVFQPDTMEQGLAQLYLGIVAGFDIIGVDSVAAMMPKSELEKNFNDPAKIGVVAAKFSQNLPKIVRWLNRHPLVGDKTKSDPSHPGTALVLVNQERAMINTGYGGGGGEQKNTTGGRALKYFAYERIVLARVKSEMLQRRDPNGKKISVPYGNVTNVKVVKSKIDAKQGHSTQIFIRYGFGIDDYFSVIETGVAYRLIRRDGAVYTLGTEKFKGREAFRKYLIDNPTTYNALRAKLAELVNAGAVVAPDEGGVDEDHLVEGDALDLDDDLDHTLEEVMADESSEEENSASPSE